ncbi:uncharacterized protein [Ptychodera flava]|uniref:uncharacterized protein n=1 Tax=Ptychodera flava TaxID=63121 RepID=UPI003969DF6E
MFSRANLMLFLRLIEIPVVCFMLSCYLAPSTDATHELDDTCPPGHFRTPKGCFNCSECPYISATECTDCEIATGDKDSITAAANRRMDTECKPGFFKSLGTCMNCSICPEISAKECKECGDKDSIIAVANRETDTKCKPGFFKALGTCMNCSICTEISTKECQECVTMPLPMESTRSASYMVTERGSEIITNIVSISHKNLTQNISTELPILDDVNVGNSDQSDIAVYVCTALLVTIGILASIALLYKLKKKKRRLQCARCLTNHGQPAHQNQGCIYHNIKDGIVTFTSRVTHNPIQPEEDNSESSSTSDDNVDQLSCHSFPSMLEAGTNRQYRQCSREISV